MIVELNRVYVIGAPKASEGMTPTDDDFLESTSNDMLYVFANKVHSASSKEKIVKILSKIFTHKDLVLQAIVYYVDIPDKMAKKKLNDRVAAHKKATK